MKTRIIEKNGFPKPLGMILIIIVLSLTCFVNLVFAKDIPASDQEVTSIEVIDYSSEDSAYDGITANPYKIGL